MANWNKLNQEFSTLIDNLTDDDWNNWQANREAKKTMRRLEMQLRAKIQADKITLSSRIGHQILNETEMSSGWIYNQYPLSSTNKQDYIANLKLDI